MIKIFLHSRLDILSRENELELEIDIPKEELGVFLHASNDNKFAELSERNVKKHENLCNDDKEEESKESSEENVARKEMTVEEAMEALHSEEVLSVLDHVCNEPSDCNNESGHLEQVFGLGDNTIKSGHLEQASELDESIDKPLLENSETLGMYTNLQSDSKDPEETQILDKNTNIESNSKETEKMENSEIPMIERPAHDSEFHTDSKDTPLELRREDCSSCKICEVSMRWNRLEIIKSL